MRSKVVIEFSTTQPKPYFKEPMTLSDIKEYRKEFEEAFHRTLYEKVRDMISEDDEFETRVMQSMADDFDIKNPESFNDLFKKMEILIR
jgi:hypothetical protein